MNRGEGERTVTSKSTGLFLGLGFGFAGSVLLFFGLGGYFIFLPFIGLAPLAIGPFVGVFLAKLGAIPSIRLVPLIVWTLFTASAPILSGAIEIQLREAPFPFPPNAQVVQSTDYPWGERIVFLESSAEVPAFFEQLVAAANSAGWKCKSCFFQSATGSGHATFLTSQAPSDSPRGHLGFEVWHGGPGYYGRPPSDTTQARIFHDLRTKSPWYAFVALSISLLAAVLVRIRRKSP